MPNQPVRDVPKARVGEIVQLFIDDGDECIEAMHQGNGKYTVGPCRRGFSPEMLSPPKKPKKGG